VDARELEELRNKAEAALRDDYRPTAHDLFDVIEAFDAQGSELATLRGIVERVHRIDDLLGSFPGPADHLAYIDSVRREIRAAYQSAHTARGDE
jgi:hypothetical protein